jgi:threonyl-tRNA synthetase
MPTTACASACAIPTPNKYTGTPSNWDKAEAACREAAETLGVPFTEEPGEAAFYGPKIDFVVKDVIGREWQLGTVQVDYNLPVRFDLNYIGADNQPHRPVMIHRAPFGSMERFCGVLIEHFAGDFPVWLAPEQVRLVPISDKGDRLRAATCSRSSRPPACARRSTSTATSSAPRSAAPSSTRSPTRSSRPEGSRGERLRREIATRALPQKLEKKA